MNNLHVSLTEFRNESRVVKETISIAKGSVAHHVYIAALHAPDQSECERIADRVTLNRIRLRTRGFPKKTWAHAIKYFEFSIRILGRYRKRDVGIINIHHIGLLPLGILLKHFFGAFLVYDTHELETEVEGLDGKRKKMLKWLEKACIRHCDEVFVVSAKIADWYADNYAIPRPTVVFNSPPYQNCPHSNKLRKALNISPETTIFLYQGGLFKGRGIEVILETFGSLHDANAAVVIMGYGPLQDTVQQAAKNCRNIYFHPAVPIGDLLDYTASADVGLSLIEGSCLSYLYSMPNKLFEYAMAGLPVIVSNMPEMASYVNDHSLGLVVKEHSSAALRDAMQRLASSDLESLKRNALTASRTHCWEVQEQKMLNAYRRLLSQPT